MEKRTALGTAALIIGANLPDLDVIAYFDGPAADLEWRRGWTHGVLALAVLPLALTACLLLFDTANRSRRGSDNPAVVPKQLLLLSFVGILSHPMLDLLNTYGVRWLMPFSGTWFYGDALFIVDPWIWMVLTVGVLVSREQAMSGRPRSSRPAGLAIATVTLYIAAMAVSGRVARAIIVREVGSLAGGPVLAAMAGPVPLTPLVRRFVIEQRDQYLVGTFRWLERPHVRRSGLRTFRRGRPSHPALEAALHTEPARRFLVWARFPTFEVQPAGENAYLVHLVDLRYAERPGAGFGTMSIPVTLR